MKSFRIVSLVITSCIAWLAWAAEEVNLSPEQKQQALDEFKARVFSKLTEDFMKHDIYLTRFLVAQDYDVNIAEELILENMQWRKDNKIDTIHTEDFADIEVDFRAFIESVDRDGRPIITGNFGDWDLRKAVASGRMKRLERYVDRNTEVARRKVEELRVGGKNISQFDILVDMTNYNVAQHGCVQCLPFYVYVTNSYERHYPGSVHKILLVNTPPTFEMVLDIIKPLMSPPTREALNVFNQDKNQWGPLLDKLIAPEELPQEFGGTKVYSKPM